VDWYNIQILCLPSLLLCGQDNTKDLSGWSYRPIAVFPDWPNQAWYGAFLDIIIKRIFLPPSLEGGKQGEPGPGCNNNTYIVMGNKNTK